MSVYVCNLHPKVTEEVLWELFLQAGPIIRCHIRRTTTGAGEGCGGGDTDYGFVEFEHLASVNYACFVLCGVEVFGCPLVVEARKGARPALPSSAISVFVGDLASDQDETDVGVSCARFGRVLDCHVVRENADASYRSKGFAFVTFDTPASAIACVQSLNGAKIAKKSMDSVSEYLRETQKTTAAPQTASVAPTVNYRPTPQPIPPPRPPPPRPPPPRPPAAPPCVPTMMPFGGGEYHYYYHQLPSSLPAAPPRPPAPP